MKSIKTKLYLIISGLVLISLCSTIGLFYKTTVISLHENAVKEMEAFAVIIGKQIGNSRFDNSEQLQQTVQFILGKYELVYSFTIYNNYTTIVASTFERDIGTKTKSEDHLQTIKDEKLRIDISKEKGGGTFSRVTVPVYTEQGDRVVGGMEIVYKLEGYDVIVERLRRNSIYILIGFFLLSIVAAALIASQVTKPLIFLKRSMRTIADGDFDVRLETNRKDEYGDVLNTCNKMASDLKAFTSELNRSRIYVDNILNSMLDCLFVLDSNGVIQTVNQAGLSLTGYEEKEILGLPVMMMIKREQDSLKEYLYKNLHQQGLARNLEATLTTKDGRNIPILLSGSAMYNCDDNVQATVLVAQDITKLKEADELKRLTTKLEQSNQELQDFAHIASHDLQEPLRKVTTFGDRLKTTCGDALGDKGNDYLERMQGAARRMQGLINGLLSFSRVTTKARPFEPVDLSVIVQEVMSDLEVRVEETKGQVHVGDLTTIDADPLQMRQLFQNLIGNALKFNRKGESPIVKVDGIFVDPAGQPSNNTGMNGHYQITIEDNGIGFDEKYADRIFGVFQRLHGRTEYEGTGIGLSVCKKIVERHCGKIIAKNFPDEGAKFIVRMPVKQIG